MWLVERLSETQARSCSRPVLTVRTQLSSYMKEECQEDWTGIFSLRGANISFINLALGSVACGCLCASRNGTAAHEPNAEFDSSQ